MRLVIDRKGKALPIPSHLEKLIRQSVALSLARMNADPTSEVSLLLTDDETMQGINQNYRGIDQTTDVLSFAFLEGQNPIYRRSQGMPMLLGEIIISTERAASQAAEYGHSIERELVFLTIHGVLHLLGMDHEEDGERRHMEETQEQILTVMRLHR